MVERNIVRTGEVHVAAKCHYDVRLIRGELASNLKVGESEVAYVGISEQLCAGLKCRGRCASVAQQAVIDGLVTSFAGSVDTWHLKSPMSV